MIGVYKLIFDLALFYTLSGFYIRVLFVEEVSALGLVLLCLTVVTYMLLRLKGVQEKRCRLALLLPVFALLAFSGWFTVIQLLIGWAYVAYSLINEKIYIDQKSFQNKFKRGCCLLLLMIPGLLFSKQSLQAFVSVISYILLQMISGICCLRTLREENNGRQGLIILAIVVGCGVLTLAGVPQLIALGLKCVWDILMQGLSLLALVLAYGIIWLLEWLVSLGQGLSTGKTPRESTTTAEILGIDEALLTSDTGEILWLEIFGYILLALLIIAGIFFLLRYLLGNRNQINDKKISVWTEERETLGVSRRKRSWRKPQEPRMAVRYYYALFIRECQRRGILVQSSSTSQELTCMSEDVFGDNSQELRNLYISARYSLRQPVATQQGRQAARLWQSLKRTKNPK